MHDYLLFHVVPESYIFSQNLLVPSETNHRRSIRSYQKHKLRFKRAKKTYLHLSPSVLEPELNLARSQSQLSTQLQSCLLIRMRALLKHASSFPSTYIKYHQNEKEKEKRLSIIEQPTNAYNTWELHKTLLRFKTLNLMSSVSMVSFLPTIRGVMVVIVVSSTRTTASTSIIHLFLFINYAMKQEPLLQYIDEEEETLVKKNQLWPLYYEYNYIYFLVGQRLILGWWYIITSCQMCSRRGVNRGSWRGAVVLVVERKKYERTKKLMLLLLGFGEARLGGDDDDDQKKMEEKYYGFWILDFCYGYPIISHNKDHNII